MLTLDSVTRGDSGKYSCDVLDFDVTDENVKLDRELQLTVNCKRPFVPVYASVRGYEGS